MSDTTAYREALASELEIAGERCIEILDGTAPFDPLIVLAAVSAAAAHPTLPAALAPLRARVLRAAADRADALDDAIDALDLSDASIDLDGPGDEREDRLDRLVNLACIAGVAGSAAQARIRAALERNEVLAVCEPDVAAPLAERAVFLGDALDLAPMHAARPLLAAILDASHVVRAAFAAGAFARAVERGREDAAPTVRGWGAAAAAYGNVVDIDVFRRKRQLQHAPSPLAAAADSGGTPVPHDAWETCAEAYGVRVEVAEIADAGAEAAVYVAVLASPDARIDLRVPGVVTITRADGTPATHASPRSSELEWWTRLGPGGPSELTVTIGDQRLVVELVEPSGA